MLSDLKSSHFTHSSIICTPLFARMDLETSSARFPNEIYSEILQYLHSHRNRPVLLSLALVNRTLRHESQKILFSIMDRGRSHEQRGDEHIIMTHTLFLQAIINDPKRLGPYVLTYTQDGMACDPDNEGKSISST